MPLKKRTRVLRTAVLQTAVLQTAVLRTALRFAHALGRSSCP